MSDHFPAILSLQATLKPDKDFLYMATSMVALTRTLGRAVSFTVPGFKAGDEIHVTPSASIEIVAQSLASHFQLTMEVKLDVPLWIPVEQGFPPPTEITKFVSVNVLCRVNGDIPFVGYFIHPCRLYPNGTWISTLSGDPCTENITHWLRLPPGYLEHLS